MVSVLGSRSSGGLTGTEESLSCVLGKTLLTVPLSTQLFKWVPVNLVQGVLCYRNRDKFRPDSSLGLNADFTFTFLHAVIVEFL